MSKLTTNIIYNNDDGLHFVPSSSLFFPLEGTSATSQEFTISSSASGSEFLQGGLIPYIIIPVLSGSSTSDGQDVLEIIRYHTSSYDLPFSTFGASSSLYFTSSNTRATYRDVAIEGTDNPSTILLKTYNVLFSSSFNLRTYSASIQTNESIKLNFLSRGYFNPPTIFTSSISTNRFFITTLLTGSGDLNYTEPYLINVASSSISFTRDRDDTNSMEFTIGTGSFGYTADAPYTLMYFSSSGKIGIGTKTPKADLEVTGSIQADKIITKAKEGRPIVISDSEIKFYETTQIDPEHGDYAVDKERARIKVVPGSFNLVFEVSGSSGYTNSVYISQSGKIGFNTDDPQTGFDAVVEEAQFQQPGSRKGLKINNEGNIESFNKDIDSATTGSEFILRYSRGTTINAESMNALFGEGNFGDEEAVDYFNSLRSEEQSSILEQLESLGFNTLPNVGDTIGSIRFIAESGSVAGFSDRTTGEAASISSKVHSADATGVRGDLIFSVADQTGTSVQRMVIDAGDVHQLSGSLNIGGATSAAGALNIKGPSGNNQINLNRYGGSSYDQKVGKIDIHDDGNVKVRFSAKGQSYITATNDGTHTTGARLGIGTTDPKVELEVIGDISASGNLIVTNITASDMQLKGTIYDVTLPGSYYINPSGASRVNGLNLAGTLTAGVANLTTVTSTNITASNNISASGTITANSFVGAFTGAVTGDATGLTGVPDITVGNITATGTVTAQEFHTEFVSASIIFSSGSTKFGDSSDDIHQFSGSLRVTGSGDHYFTDGNVGIGTTTPTHKLDVNGNMIADGYNVGNTSNYIDIATGLRLRSDSNGIRLMPNGTDAGYIKHTGVSFTLPITASGNISASGTGSFSDGRFTGKVGIGITNPTTPLHVAGIAQIVESGNTAFYEGNGVRVFGTQNYRFRNTGGGVRAIIDVNSTGVTAGNLTLYNASNAVTTKLNNAGDSYFNGGNVGIGTTSPTGKLHVSGAVANSDFYVSSSGNVGIGTTDPQYAKLQVNGTTLFQGASQIQGDLSLRGNIKDLNHDGTAFVYTTTRYTGGSELGLDLDFVRSINATNGGNIGIGTTTPTEALTVTGNISASGNLSIGNGGDGVSRLMVVDSDSQVTLEKSAGGYFTSLGFDSNQNYLTYYSSPGMLIGYGSTTGAAPSVNTLFLKADGNVGIGTTSPSAKLHVVGDAIITGTITAQEFHTEFVSASIIFTSGSTKFGDSSDDIHQFSGSLRVTGSGDHYFTDGNVGIGTDSPDYKLEVDGTSDFGDTMTFGNAARGTITWGNGSINSGDVFSLVADTSQYLSFGSNNIDGRMVMDTSGNVGIGTTAPTEKLQVTGNISASGNVRAATIGMTNIVTNRIPFFNGAQLASSIVYNRNGGIDVEGHITASGNISLGGHIYLPVNKYIYSNNNPIIGATAAQTEIYATNNVINFYAPGGGSHYGTFNAGNFGIGTASPSAKLHIAGNIWASGSTATGAGHITASGNISASGAIDGASLDINGDADISGNVTASGALLTDLHIYNSSATPSSATGTTLQTLTNYVGGDLNQQKSFVDFVFKDDNTNEIPQVRIGAEVGQNSDADTQAKEGSGAFIVYTNNANTDSGDAGASLGERFRVDYQGNVGIGTTAPGRKLTVAGSDNLIFLDSTGNSYLTIDRSATDRRSALVLSTAGDGTSAIPNNINWVVGAADSDEVGDGTGFFIGTNTNATSAKLFIEQAGNVGIGTTSPQELLHLFQQNHSNPLLIEVENDGYLAGTSAGIKLTSKSTGGVSGSWTIDNLNRDTLRFLDDGSEKMRITSAGNVGIGTTAPAEKLHIDGNVQVTTGGNTYLNINHGNVGFIKFTDTSISSPNQFLIQHNYAQDNDFRISRATGGVDFVIDSVGNVGIGTAAPATKLHVDGDAIITGTLTAQEFHTEFVSASIIFSSGSTKFGDSSDDIHQFSGSLRVTGSGDHYFANGNVGIGTTAPSEKLHVAGNITLGNNKSIAFRDSSGNAGTSIAYTSNGLFKMSQANAGELRFNAGFGDNSNNKITFYTRGTLERMIITNDGNVGIGTTTPTEALQVTGNISASGNILANQITASNSQFGSGGKIEITHSGGSGVIDSKTANLTIKTSGNERISLSPAGAESLTVAHGGNVGIGTTTPTEALTVVGNISASGEVNIDSAAALFSSKLTISGDAYTTGGWKLGTGATYVGKAHSNSGIYSIEADTNRDIQFGDAGTPAVMYIDNSTEKVGIGTTTPAQLLHVYGGAATIEIDSTTNESVLNFDNSVTTANIKLANGDLKAELGGSEVLRISSSGNVGIGTATPDASLNIKGSGNDSNTTSLKIVDSDNASLLYVRNDGIVNVGRGYFYVNNSNGMYSDGKIRARAGITDDQGPLLLGNNDAVDAMTISSSKVGIGTTTPDSILHLKDTGTPTITLEDSSGGTQTSTIKYSQEGQNQLYITTNYDSPSDLNRIYLQPGGETAMTLRGGDNSTGNAGNVGIGTTTPTERLEVIGNISASGTLNVSTFASIQDVDTGNPTPAADETRVSGYGIIGNRSAYYITNANAGSLIFGVGGTHSAATKMTILDSGNVGIGTTAPTEKLQVTGNISASGALQLGATVPIKLLVNGGAPNDSTEFRNGGGEFKIYSGRTTNAKHQSFVFASGDNYTSGATRMIITGSTGNVGIGTTTPTEKLTVEGDISASVDIHAQRNINMGLKTDDPIFSLYNNQNLNKIYTSHSASVNNAQLTIQGGNYTHAVNFKDSYSNQDNYATLSGGYINDSKLILFNSSSQLTTTLSTATSSLNHLNVGGNINFTGTTANTLNSVVNLTLNADSDSNSGDAYRNIIFQNRGSENMRIAAAGNVGIGTTTPTEKLQVTGDISASGDIHTQDKFIVRSSGALVKIENPGWTSAANHDILYNGWTSDVDDYVYLKAGGNSTSNHGIIAISDAGGFFVGNTNTETGASSAAPPFDRLDFRVDIAGNVTASGNISASGTGYFKNTFIKPTDAGSALTVYEMDSNNNAIQLRSYANRGDIYLYSDGSKTTEISAIGDSFFKGGLTVGTGSGASRAAILDVTGDIQTLGSNGHITASGNISASGDVFGQKFGNDLRNHFDFSTDNQLHYKVNNVNKLLFNQSRLAPAADLGTALGASNLRWNELNVNHITASGNISASGQFLGANFGLDSTDKLQFSDGTLQFRLNDASRITHTSTIFRPTSDEGVSLGRSAEKWKELVVNHITASGNISGSSTSTLTMGGAATIGGTVQASSYKIGGSTVLQGSSDITIGSGGATGTISLTTHTSTPFKIENDDSISITSDTTITGALRATTKSFVIDTPEGGKLEYGSLEGRQHDVFHKGKCNNNVIELPKEWEWLIDNTTLTVQLTAIGKHQNLYVKEIKNNKVYISAGMFKTPNCYFLIHASRKDTKQIEHDN
jgi:hypothetical protein